MLCPNGHKPDKERGDCNEVVFFCAFCGWRRTFKVKFNHKARWRHRQIQKEQQKRKGYALLDKLRADNRGGGDEYI